jgi:hypothetical protein
LRDYTILFASLLPLSYLLHRERLLSINMEVKDHYRRGGTSL